MSENRDFLKEFVENTRAEDAENAEAAAETSLKDQVIAALRTIYDPEIPVNIYELGLIYDVELDEDDKVDIRMTLTSPMCPVAESLPIEVQQKASAVPGVTHVNVDLVWEPPWDMSLLSEAAKLELGWA